MANAAIRRSSMKVFFLLLTVVPAGILALSIFLLIRILADEGVIDFAAVVLMFLSLVWIAVLVLVAKVIRRQG